MTRNISLPLLMIFGLDRVLWPFCMDYSVYVLPPFKIDRDGVVVDDPGRPIEFYADVPDILEDLYQHNITMAAVSLTKKMSETEQLIHLLGWDKYFKYKHFSPESMYFHFVRLQRISGIDYEHMLYFDYDFDCLTTAAKLGVISMVVREGLNETSIRHSIIQYRILHGRK